MYEQTPAPLPESEPSSFTEIWIAALTKPNEETYRQFANSPRASTGTAYLWMAVSGAISSLLSLLVNSFTGANPFGTQPDLFTTLTCSFPVALAVSLIVFSIGVGYATFVGRALGGQADFDKLAYAMAAFMAPLGLVSSVISIIPVVNCLVFAIGIYGIYLSIVAVKAAHDLEEWGKAFLASPVVLGLALGFCALCVIIMLALSGAAMSDVFQDIINQLNQPY